MARGYQADEIKQRLVGLLKESKTGMSGVEISERLQISRVTITKYLSVFAAEGLIRQKNIGNVTLWFVDEGTEQFQFPDDYILVQKKYQGMLLEYAEDSAYTLIRNCAHSDAKIQQIMTEVIVPTKNHIKKLFDDGKIGDSEQSLLYGMISKSVQLLYFGSGDTNSQKNVLLIAADSASRLLCESAYAIFKKEQWRVLMLGDMSASVDVLFDLDLQKFLGKVWKKRPGIMVIVVFSDTEEGLNFFAESVESAKGKIGKNVRLVLYGRTDKKTPLKSDLTTEDLGEVLRWSEDEFEKI